MTVLPFFRPCLNLSCPDLSLLGRVPDCLCLLGVHVNNALVALMFPSFSVLVPPPPPSIQKQMPKCCCVRMPLYCPLPQPQVHTSVEREGERENEREKRERERERERDETVGIQQQAEVQ